MEHQQDSSLFGMSLDQAGRGHLAEAARWAKFLAIIGFIGCGLIVLVGLFAGTVFSSMMGSAYERNPYNDYGATPAGFSMMLAVYYIIIAVIYFFPCLYLFRFATKMKTALAANDQETLNGSFQNLKATLRFMGILTLIAIVFIGLAFIIGLIGIAAGSRM